MPKNIGIDLGTTNSCVSYLEGREPVIMPNPEGSRVIPSMVALNRDGKRIFGNTAKRQFVTNNENTIWGVKRLIGRKYTSEEVREIQQRVGYRIVEAENGDVNVQFGQKKYSPEELSAMFLGYLRQVSEDFLGEEVENAVITVPAFFNDAQRQATKNAGEIAGLNVMRIINEPTAALIAYRNRIEKDGLYAVYDLGGGTFDISIVEVLGDVYKVVSTTGNTFLGGNDFDVKIIEWILSEINKEISIDVFSDKNNSQRIIQIAEKAKIELSFNKETQISIPYLHHFSDGTNYHFSRKLTRSQFENNTIELMDKTIGLIEKSLKKINITPEKIEKVILVGGQSRMPLISKKVGEFFEKEPFIDLNPEEVVSQGAALQSEIIGGTVKDLLLLDVTSLSLGVETKGDNFDVIIESNSTIPIKRSKLFTTITDNQQTVTIHVLQGEREIASKNNSLGYFNLVGIPPSPKGIPLIDVIFEINSNGIVKVSAKDKKTGLIQSMKVQPASGLSPEDIKKIKKESKEYEIEDIKLMKVNRVKAELEEELSSVKFFFDRHNEKLKEKQKNEIRSTILKAETSMETKDDLSVLENILKKIQKLRLKINNILISEFED